MSPALLRADRRFTKYKGNIFTEQGINSNNLLVLQSPMCFPTYLWSHSNNVLEHSTLSKRKIKEFIYMGDGCNANGFCVITSHEYY